MFEPSDPVQSKVHKWYHDSEEHIGMAENLTLSSCAWAGVPWTVFFWNENFAHKIIPSVFLSEHTCVVWLSQDPSNGHVTFLSF